MEYVDGVDLKALLEWRRRINRRVPIAHGLYLILEMCKGLAYAHELLNPETNQPFGIVHRDISPPNVLISKQGEVKVVDFGLAKATSQVEITDPGVVKGKMSYLSPEAARGEEVDHRADIFAVGILLYELLTGKRLFYGETDYQTVELVRNAKIPPIKPQNPQVEPELEDIVRKALAKRKEDRYQNATDIQDALAQYAYSRGLKVIARDIAELVRQCLEDRRMQSGEGKSKTSIIDHLLQDEIAKFTSVEEDEQDAGARPLSADELSPRAGSAPPPSDGDFIDPRAWAEERLTPVMGIAEVDAMEARKTSRDVAPVAPPSSRRAAPARVPTPAPVRPPPDPMDQTPGPETLASVLEPTPSPEALPPEALSATLEPPPTRSVAVKAPGRPKKGRNFLIGAAIGILLLGAIVALARKNTPSSPPQQQPPPASTQSP
jgi:serine/threonine-protein kinase